MNYEQIDKHIYIYSLFIIYVWHLYLQMLSVYET